MKKRDVSIMGAVIFMLAGALASHAQPPAPTPKDSRGGNGYPDQTPVAGWIRAIAARQAKLRSLSAEYEIQRFLRGRRKPAIESGIVKFRFFKEADRAPLERWEGRGESGAVVRIVRDGREYALRHGKASVRELRKPGMPSPASFRFPLLPAGAASRHYVFHSREFETGVTAPAPGRPFPTALGFMIKPRSGFPGAVRRFYLALDDKTGAAYRIRWTEDIGTTVEVELFALRPDAPVTDADFAPPPAKDKDPE
jgi:hypothetical protein